MTTRKLASEMRRSYKWLVEQDCGCSHWPIGEGLAIAMGWIDNSIYAKIGRITGLQCDFDCDFPMPADPETGDVFDTMEQVWTVGEDTPKAKTFYAIAYDMNHFAPQVKKFARGED
jgi:hypothetical protein